jgi:ADP-ribose pyrophosphatase YjhB (NUDIX family)
VILKDGHLLLLRKEYEDGSERFALPGGSQDAGETLEAALQRECREEIGSGVSNKGLLYLADYFKPRDTDPPSYRQQVEYYFLCEVPGDYEAHNGHHPDRHQVAVVWIPQQQLSAINLLPAELARLFTRDDLRAWPIYLGQLGL